MTRRQRVARPLAVLILGFSSFIGYRAIASYRDLQETLLWIDQTYNPHEGGDNSDQGHGSETLFMQEGNVQRVSMTFKTTLTHDGGCNIVSRSEVLSVGIFEQIPSVTTYKLNLRDIAPDSIEVKTRDSHDDVSNCADPEMVKLYNLNCDIAEINFLTRDGATAINEERVQTFTKLTGSEHEQKSVSKTTNGSLLVDDVLYAQRLAKALKHAVEACGGKPSRF
jgi:hypothetical protein